MAKKTAQRGIDISNEPSAGLYVSLARAYREQNNFIEARKVLNRARKLFSNHSEVLSWLGVIEFDENNFSTACDFMKKAHEYNLSSPSIAHNYAVCLLRSNQFDEANSIMRVALSNSPSTPYLYYLNGVIEEKRKNYLSALKSWQTYLSLVKNSDPNYKLVEYKISEIYESGKKQVSEQDFPN